MRAGGRRQDAEAGQHGLQAAAPAGLAAHPDGRHGAAHLLHHRPHLHPHRHRHLRHLQQHPRDRD